LLPHNTRKLVSTFFVSSYCHESDIEVMVVRSLCGLAQRAVDRV
jgi:hypothetical protein